MDMLKTVTPNIHKEGTIFILIFAVVSLILGMIFGESVGWVGTVLTCWCIYFFRDPTRVTPEKEGLIISPADGIVQKIEEAPLPPELGMDTDPRTRISIFLNVFNVHVNRIPIAGNVTRLFYNPGKFLNASLDKASEENERQAVCVTTDEGKEIVFVQIAGLIARRIVCDLKKDQKVETGERYGIIRFGSRMDVYLPKAVNPLVVVGQTMVGGETILADIKSHDKTRTGTAR
ncbi:MAG: phosphatidylserine decarboxylase [Proteobacteria bacterium]|nr:phosphatidylserine decarboxylase [Pseudomonadota bacterium]